MFTFGVLGPVDAWADGRRLALGTPQQRVVLAAILLNEGAVASTGQLVEALWADRPPAGAVKSVRTYVSRLRSVLGPAGAIESAGGGYLLRLDPAGFDLARFRELTAPARTPEPARRLREALGLFRGEPLAGLPGEWAETQRAQLSQLRAAAYESLYTAELAAGRHAQVLAEIPAVIRQFPFRENLHESYLIALYRAGLRAEAFTAYRELQEMLKQELGIEPSAALRDLHLRMLQGDAALTATPAQPERKRPAPVVLPAQLPAAPAVFTGRDSELRRADELLEASTTGPAIVVITGMGGVGKTSLALHWGHRLAARYTDGQLYADLRGYGPGREPMSAAEVLDGFLQALGVDAASVPESGKARAGLFRSLVADRRMLILLDNAASADQVLDLLPGTGTSLVVVTSRGSLPDLVVRTAAPLLELRPPAYEQALALFAARAGADRVTAEPAAARDIVELSGRLPLALAVVAARAAASAHLPLSGIAGDLSAARGTLSGFRLPGGAADVRAVLSWSYHALGDRAAEALRRLSLHPGPDLNTEVAASMLGRPVAETRGLLAELVAASLLLEHRPGRWTMHDLVRAYGNDVALDLDPLLLRQESVHRMLDYYLYAGWDADSRLFNRKEPILPERPAPGVSGADAEPAVWFDAEYPALLSALDLALEQGLDRHAWQLSWVVRGHLSCNGLWHHLQTSQQAGYAAAARSGEPVVVARTLWGLAQADLTMGRCGQADTRLRRALTVFEQAGDEPGVERSRGWLAFLYSEQGEWAAALEQYQAVLLRYPPGADPIRRAGALNAVSWAQARLGRYADAVAGAREAIRNAEGLAPYPMADIWDTLGYALAGLGDVDGAADSYLRAVDLYRRHGSLIHAAESLRALADRYAQVGRGGEAEDAYREALTIAVDLDGPRAARISAELSRLLATG